MGACIWEREDAIGFVFHSVVLKLMSSSLGCPLVFEFFQILLRDSVCAFSVLDADGLGFEGAPSRPLRVVVEEDPARAFSSVPLKGLS